MEAGSGMLYPTQVVDGVVHRLGGKALRDALARARPAAGTSRCAVGDAVVTAAAGALAEFDLIAHTPTPFWPREDATGEAGRAWLTQLQSCYVASAGAIGRATEPNAPLMVAAPLLGAGAGGAPVADAARAAAGAVARMLAAAAGAEMREVTLRFVVQGPGPYEALHVAIADERLRDPAAWERVEVTAERPAETSGWGGVSEDARLGQG